MVTFFLQPKLLVGLAECLKKYHRDVLTECIMLMTIFNGRSRKFHCIMGSN